MGLHTGRLPGMREPGVDDARGWVGLLLELERHREERIREARKRLRNAVEDFDSLPAGEGVAEFKIREKFIISAVRFHYCNFRSIVILKASVIPLILLFTATGWIYLIALLPVWRGILGALIFSAAMVCTTLLFASISQRTWRLTFISDLIRLTAGTALVAGAVAVYSMQRGAINPELVWVLLGALSGGFAAASLSILCLSVISGVASYVMQEAVGVKRYDAALVKWVEAAFLIHSSKDRIQRFDTLKKCLFGIEKAARRIETIGYPAKVSGLLESHQKAVMRDEAQRMAEAFRAHKSALVKASRPEDVDVILESMLAGVKALATGDTRALLENAPDRISRSDRLRRFAVWILPPITLISAGLLLPMIPAVASQGAAVGSLRWSLIIAGVLSIVAAQKDVAARINDTLGKAMTWK